MKKFAYAALMGAGLALAPYLAHADRCIGAVVNGQCMGTVMPDYSQPMQRPADSFTRDGSGLRTAPNPGPGFEGPTFYNRTRPMTEDGRLRWYDPDELERR